MNSRLNLTPKESNEIKYPILMSLVSHYDRVIVLFISETEGTVVFDDRKEEYRLLGKTARNWISCKDNKEWKKYYGEVILSND